jgi:alanine dehydrogenase
MAEKKSQYSDIAARIGMMPKEALMEVGNKKGSMYIGIPKEVTFKDNRVPLTPPSVGVLINNGHRVVIESGAGTGSNFSDKDYAEVGAEIVQDAKAVFEADLIVKIAPMAEKQLDMIKPGQKLISAINLPSLKDKHIKKLMDAKVTAMALEYVREEAGIFPFVRSMSEIAGHSAILIASELLNNVNDGKGVLLGSVSGNPPSTVVVLGAGVVGEFAVRTALGLGAEVRVFDNNIYKLMRLQNNIGQRIFTSVINPKVLRKELANCAVAVGAIHAESGLAPTVVSEDMVEEMKPGSVIIDVSIDQGGCFETSDMTTHDKPTFRKHDVIHYCVPNIASRVARSASYAISNLLLQMLIKAQDVGGIERLIHFDPNTRHGIYLYKGSLTNEYLAQRYDLKFTDLDLLFAANL